MTRARRRTAVAPAPDASEITVAAVEWKSNTIGPATMIAAMCGAAQTAESHG
jgi:hypothetical protein